VKKITNSVFLAMHQAGHMAVFKFFPNTERTNFTIVADESKKQAGYNEAVLKLTSPLLVKYLFIGPSSSSPMYLAQEWIPFKNNSNLVFLDDLVTKYKAAHITFTQDVCFFFYLLSL
jgi:hypothetical protein